MIPIMKEELLNQIAYSVTDSAMIDNIVMIEGKGVSSMRICSEFTKEDDMSTLNEKLISTISWAEDYKK